MPDRPANLSPRASWRTDRGETVWRVLFWELRQIEEPRQWLGCSFWVTAIFFHSWAGAAGVGVAWLLTGMLRFRPKSVVPLLTLPLPAMAYPCEVQIRRDGLLLGADRGVVSFVDGWLLYDGFGTSFSLSRSDAAKRRQNDVTLQDGSEVWFRPEDKVEGPGVSQTGLQRSFAEALDRWYRLDSAAKGISILPPNGLSRQGVVRAGLHGAIALAAVSAWLFGAIPILFSGSWWPLWVAFLGGTLAWNALRNAVVARSMMRHQRRALANPSGTPIRP